jgi:acyl-CoA thioester hydrolase
MQVVATTRVRYAETDAMGIAYHSNYLVWFEVARTELFRAIGLPYTKFESDGLALAVVEANIRYKAPVKYDDLLDLQAEVAEMNNRKVVFHYKICNQQNIVCEGSTVHLFINQEGRSTNASGYPVWSEVRQIFEL